MEWLRFEWDHAKSESNRRKHGVTFDEASTTFEDPNAIIIDDLEQSKLEDRFILLGLSAQARILVVCHCLRDSESTIRIISARRATRRESLTSWQGLES